MTGDRTSAKRSQPTQRRCGRFIVLDGIDGCGKTTQAGRLAAALEAAGREPRHVREPGTSKVAERIRALLLEPELPITAKAETLLFAAARTQSLYEVVQPALSAGGDVVCERFHPSTYAYQAVAGGEDPERVRALLEEWAGDPAPDLVLVLDVDPEAAARRRGGDHDRIEMKGLEFQKAVARGYREWVELDPRAVLVDGNREQDLVFESVWSEVQRVL